MFSVQACSDVRVLLSEDPYRPTGHLHEVVLGAWNNTKSLIYADVNTNTTGVEVNTPALLSCEEMRTFWIQWQLDGLIVVGQGSLNTSELMRYRDPSPHPILAVSISTGEGSIGKWRFNRRTGGLY